ncbi:MAG TPA: SusD/RagB family nutrient-binding outer membrane lipoprotein, partial [Mucilaginibacter sp.]|nr:SusD/RagB family nutrient-binding outer membrane lipoprotein [Mucilaginibacter sp.]
MKTIYHCFRKRNSLAGLCILAGLLAISSCTKNFEKYNTNPNAVTEDQLKGDGQNIGGFFPDMETSIMRIVDWEYQVQQNLNADLFSGYMMSADPFGGNNNTSYALNSGWDTYAFDEPYQHVMSNWLQIKTRGEVSNPDFYAVALILKVEAMHRVTDIFGPIPYTKFGTASFSIPYDSQQDVYNRFFKELDTAVNSLTTYVTANPTAMPFKKFDLIYGGDYKEWIKFANTLRLRLAMHIVYADPTTAQAEAEKAVANSYGLLSTTSDDALVNMVNGISYQNPISVITHSWGDISMGAPLESILTG